MCDIYKLDKAVFEEIVAEKNLLQQISQINFSQMSVKDNLFIYRCARVVPDNGTIVEIGTAQGGSAYIFSIATQKRDVKIISIDKYPSQEAKQNLKGMNVTLVTEDSVEYAKTWRKEKNDLIDLLFIDGGHTLLDVYNDYSYWSPLVRPGGMIIFHDYDPIYDGGVNHLAVRIFCDALLREGMLVNARREDNCLLGYKPMYDLKKIFLNTVLISLSDIGQNIVRIINREENIIQVWDQTFSKFGRLLNPEDQPVFLSLISNKRSFVITDGSPKVIDKLLSDSYDVQTLPHADKLTICYLLGHFLVNNDYNRILEWTRNRHALFHWHEGLMMFNIAARDLTFPYNFERLEQFKNVESLSRFIASEQTKLLILMELERECL